MQLKVAVTVASMALFWGLSAQADEAKFAERKSQALSHIDKKIANLNEHKTCINNASKKGDLKACHQTHKSKMQTLRGEFKEMRGKMKGHKKHK